MKVKKEIKKIIPPALLSTYHFLLAWLGAVIYRFPSREMTVIGVTGTSGKSTVVELIHQLFTGAGQKTAALSSIGFHLGQDFQPNQLKMTMPGRFNLQRFLARAKKEKCQLVVVEVTSEGILQHRHRFIDFDSLVFTNLSPEHIERHGGFENYKRTKGRLFAVWSKGGMKKKSPAVEKTIIINLDDSHASYFSSFPAERKLGYGIEKMSEKIESLKAEKIVLQARGSTFEVKGEKFSLALPGQFNISNALAAITVGYAQGIGFAMMAQSLAKVKNMPGRLELVTDYPFQVVVDYAHHPAALEKVYQTLHPFAKRLICVLGSCGGGRDKWKRPVLGGIAARYCQRLIITNEDPYDEDPREIIAQVAKGAGGKAEEILDRREAIQTALSSALPGDIVIITGKGSESLMCLAEGKKIPWDDRQIVREELDRSPGRKAEKT